MNRYKYIENKHDKGEWAIVSCVCVECSGRGRVQLSEAFGAETCQVCYGLGKLNTQKKVRMSDEPL